MKIGFVYLGGRLQRSLPDARIPSEFFLGARELSARGHDVTMLEIGDAARPGLVAKVLTATAPLGALPAKTYVGLYQQVLQLLPALADRDVVVATSSGLAFSLAFWRWRRRLPFEVVGIQCGITHYAIGHSSRLASRFLLRRMHTQLYADAELEWMRSFFDIPRERIEANLFGVDTAFWTPGADGAGRGAPAREAPVLAVGNDARRDFETLAQAARGAPWRLTVVTRRPLPPLSDNVTVIRGSYTEGVSDAELRDLYRDACCVVVPLKPGLQPSGQSVTLQAMACGTPVVLSRTAGLFDVGRLRDGEQLLLTDPGDPAALRAAVDRIVKDPSLRARLAQGGLDYVRRHGRIEGFADRLEALCARIVPRPGAGRAGTR